MAICQKTVLIIGAGREQVPAYVAAKKMGLKIISTDIDKNAPGFSYADYKILVSTREAEQTFQKVKIFCKSKKLRIDGVFTIANDVPLTVAKIANYYSLPGLSIDSTKLLSDKISMKEKFLESNIKTPPFRSVRDMGDVEDFSKVFDFPIVLKPVDGRGSKGVLILKNLKDIRKFFYIPKAVTKKEYLIVEKYIEGPQLSIESVFVDKKYYPVAFADRNYNLQNISYPFSFEDGGEIPAYLSKKQKQKINDLVEGASKCLGIDWGTVKADIVISEEEPQVIELAGRLSGGEFSTFSIPHVYGVDLVGIVIRLCLGIPVGVEEVQKEAVQAFSNRFIYSLNNGKIREFDFPEGLNCNVHLSKFLKKGDKITSINSGVQNTKAGVVKVLAPTTAEAKKVAETVVQETKFFVS